MTLTWGDPTTLDPWAAAARELRTRPGAWAQIPPDVHGRNPRARVAQINRGTIKAFRPAGAYEAKMASNRLWVRYVGKQADIRAPRDKADALKAVDGALQAVDDVMRAYRSADGDALGRALDKLDGLWPEQRAS